MKLISVEEKLPEDNQYVLAHLVNKPWNDNSDKNGGRFFKVVKFVRGISEEERAQMKSGKTEDPDLGPLWCMSSGYSFEKRSNIYRSGDEFGNNKKPYCWEEFGPGSHFGQEVDFWCELPELNFTEAY